MGYFPFSHVGNDEFPNSKSPFHRAKKIPSIEWQIDLQLYNIKGFDSAKGFRRMSFTPSYFAFCRADRQSLGCRVGGAMA
jgi:hypothetical protein